MKNCTNPNCRQINPQPFINFYVSKINKGGLELRCIDCKCKSSLDYSRRNPERKKGLQLKKYWPELTSLQAMNEYNKILKEQNGVCSACKNFETVIQHGTLCDLSVDHCHETGKVRGLLCQSCNIVLGKVKENTNTLTAMIEYLEINSH